MFRLDSDPMENNKLRRMSGLFTQEELYRLQLALESMISDDMAYIKIIEDEIKTHKNKHDNKYLAEGREILRKDIKLTEKIIDLRYGNRLGLSTLSRPITSTNPPLVEFPAIYLPLLPKCGVGSRLKGRFHSTIHCYRAGSRFPAG